ncbi:MAG: chromo domain-containing protein [Candidatus Saccharimonadales bacterium]
MLSTENRRQEYKSNKNKCSAKLMPRKDGPWKVIAAHPETSTYKLDIPGSKVHKVFHANQLHRYHANDPAEFPNRDVSQPGPIILDGSIEEYVVEKIVDERTRHGKHEFMYRWKGYGLEHDSWEAAEELHGDDVLAEWRRMHPV